MRRLIQIKILLSLGCLFGGLCVVGSAQAIGNSRYDSLDVALAYNPMQADVVGDYGFWMQGASVEVHGQFSRSWGLVADVAGLHAGTTHDAGIGLDLITATIGPRYTWSPTRGRVTVFGQALAGTVHGMNSLFPSGNKTSSTGNSFALQVGGGVDVPLSHRIWLRAFQADWLRTQLPNSTTNVQNNLRLGAGVVFILR